jgi:predicted ABC-type ATPase
MPDLIIIGGPNGSGKSTIFPAINSVEKEIGSYEPVFIELEKFVNPDNIAVENSLNDINAGKETIKRINE